MDRTAKNGMISARLLKLIAEHTAATGVEGAPAIRFAMDKVLGVGMYEALVEEVYHTLNAT